MSRAKTVTYATWVTAVTAVLAAISFLMLALSLHHATRSAVHTHIISGNVTGGGGDTSLGFHDGDV